MSCLHEVFLDKTFICGPRDKQTSILTERQQEADNCQLLVEKKKKNKAHPLYVLQLPLQSTSWCTQYGYNWSKVLHTIITFRFVLMHLLESTAQNVMQKRQTKELGPQLSSVQVMHLLLQRIVGQTTCTLQNVTGCSWTAF